MPPRYIKVRDLITGRYDGKMEEGNIVRHGNDRIDLIVDKDWDKWSDWIKSLVGSKEAQTNYNLHKEKDIIRRMEDGQMIWYLVAVTPEVRTGGDTAVSQTIADAYGEEVDDQQDTIRKLRRQKKKLEKKLEKLQRGEDEQSKYKQTGRGKAKYECEENGHAVTEKKAEENDWQCPKCDSQVVERDDA